MKKVFLIVLALSAFALVACGGGDSGTDTSAHSESNPFTIPVKNVPIREAKDLKFKANGLSGPEPKPIIPDGPPPEFLALQELIEGIGLIAEKGEKVTIQYVGYDYETGKKFVSSWDQGRPLTLTVGAGEVSEGLDQAIEGMEVSDRREAVIPPDLAQDPQGKAPSNATLVYVVDVIGTKEDASSNSSSGDKTAAAKPAGKTKPAGKAVTTEKTKPTVTVPKGAPPKKLVIKDLEEGSGPAAKAGDEVTVHYVGVDYKTGKQFDASWDRGEPFPFTLGSGGVIAGWEQGIEGMKVGGRRELIIPPNLAYGSQAAGEIAPNSTLVFVVDLLAIN